MPSSSPTLRRAASLDSSSPNRSAYMPTARSRVSESNFGGADTGPVSLLVGPFTCSRTIHGGAPGDTLSARALTRLRATRPTDDPTDEIGAAWGIKAQLRRLLAGASLAEAHEQRMLLGTYELAADMPEANRLWRTVSDWWPAIEVLLVTGVTNARTVAANTKQIKRSGRGYRNPAHYRACILLASAARRTEGTPLSALAITLKCEEPGRSRGLALLT